ncbi:hypothetical protein [Sulfitobacter sabulilitoris]|uniref:Coiled coil domain-containing protein n=1 Tax=Sulfitobacter sabulilitoris TaxID=2562655 RepID=A0A5S3QAR9_9RHOB|nr:hypothetical protein [Sulfitobacter sabulilitoris]TMM54202.1 hypothetical protein FDT80_00975 [Sulfitobacter sabulilitoris]
MDDKDAYRQKLQTRLETLRAEIDKLEAKAEHVGAEAREALRTEAKELRAKQDEARKKLEAFRKAQGDAWKDLKSGLDAAWDDLSRAVRRAADRFG